jgi:hypothetical protein
MCIKWQQNWEKTIHVDYVIIEVKEVSMPNVIYFFVHQMIDLGKTQVEIKLGVVVS